MDEEQYKISVKALTGRNREIKLHGQSKEGREQDPRNRMNDTEHEDKLKETKEEKKEAERYHSGKRDTQTENHYEEPDNYDKLNLGARSKISNKLNMNQREDYRREKNKEMYNKHDSMEYKQ